MQPASKPMRTLNLANASRYEALCDSWLLVLLSAIARWVRDLADKNFALLQHDPHHPSLRLKKVGNLWSVRVGLRHRALARVRMEGIVWFWIGDHEEYERLLKQ
jgi:predicted methyltransferase